MRRMEPESGFLTSCVLIGEPVYKLVNPAFKVSLRSGPVRVKEEIGSKKKN